MIAVFALLTLAMLGLEAALLCDRFDLAFVAQISTREQPQVKRMLNSRRLFALSIPSAGPICSIRFDVVGGGMDELLATELV